MAQTSGQKLTREAAEQVAVQALGFIAADASLLPRFLALTGIEPSAIRQAARQPGFLAGVLDFILAHEPTLMQFSEATGVAAESVLLARRALPFGDDRYDRPT